MAFDSSVEVVVDFQSERAGLDSWSRGTGAKYNICIFKKTLSSSVIKYLIPLLLPPQIGAPVPGFRNFLTTKIGS